MDEKDTDADSKRYDNQRIARSAVVGYFNNGLHHSEPESSKIELADTYVVMWSYVLGNWKALISTTVPDGMYYEVTYNKEKNEAYLDAYKKFKSEVIRYATV